MRKAVFICYRRSDSAAYAGRIRDHLELRFPNRIFMDTEEAVPGRDFASDIEGRLADCRVVLIIIGPKWVKDPRLGLPADYVTFEIQHALMRSLVLIPILVDAATMPTEYEVPAVIGAVTRRNAIHIHHASFERDTNELARSLHTLLDIRPPSRVEQWSSALSGQRAPTEVQRGVYSVLSGLIALVFLFGSLSAPEADLTDVLLFPLLSLLLCPFGWNSARLGVIVRVGLCLTLLGTLICVVRLAAGPQS
jgi:hypothetical protein